MPWTGLILRLIGMLMVGKSMQHCLIGDDFHFGKGRQGDFALLQTLSKTKGFTVEKTPSIHHNNIRISSSVIRSLLAQGKLQSAAAMLGRAFSITGTVAHGLKNGRTIVIEFFYHR
jgi:riboflavin kinase/FMN adenylyltransferase